MVNHDISRANAATVTELSTRERECLQWAGRGKSSSDIAGILELSPRTIDSYLEKACSKMGVRTRIEAVAAGVRRGIISAE